MCQGQVFIEKYPDPVSTQGVWKVLKSIEIPSQTVPVKYFSSLFFFYKVNFATILHNETYM